MDNNRLFEPGDKIVVGSYEYVVIEDPTGAGNAFCVALTPESVKEINIQKAATDAE